MKRNFFVQPCFWLRLQYAVPPQSHFDLCLLLCFSGLTETTVLLHIGITSHSSFPNKNLRKDSQGEWIAMQKGNWSPNAFYPMPSTKRCFIIIFLIIDYLVTILHNGKH